MKKKNVDITKFLDGTDYGRLKVRVFVYLNEKHPDNPPENLDELKNKVSEVFQDPDVKGIVEQWYKLTFE